MVRFCRLFPDRSIFLGCLFATILLAHPVVAQQPLPKRPALPKTFKLKLRYSIKAPRDAHIKYFDKMIGELKDVGFQFEPPLDSLPPTIREDNTRNFLTGSIAGEKTLLLLKVSYVAGILIVPDTFVLPDEPQAPIQIQLQLASGFSHNRQLVFQHQVRALVQVLGFREMVGYDSRGYSGQKFTRLRGVIPRDQLDTFLKDLRTQPTGWFAPNIPLSGYPEPLKSVNPIWIVEVIPDPMPPQPIPFFEDRGEDDFYKIGPNLWEQVKIIQPRTEPLRIELLMAFTPKEFDEGWKDALRKTAPDILVEGRLGNIVTAQFGRPHMNDQGKIVVESVDAAKQIRELSKLPFVSFLRLPRPAVVGVNPTWKRSGDAKKALEASKLVILHDRDKRGKGIRIAVLGSDFRGIKQMILAKKLPLTTVFVDLTAERNLDLVPDPIVGDPDEVGRGTHCAMAAALAAPEATLILVRIDDRSPQMIDTFLNYVSTDIRMSDALAERDDEVKHQAAFLEQQRRVLIEEEKFLFDEFEDEIEMKKKYGMFGPVRAWLFSSREWIRGREKAYQAKLKEHQAREKRLIDFFQALSVLQQVDVISNSLVWQDTYPLGGQSYLAKAISAAMDPESENAKDLKRKSKRTLPLWFQSVGNFEGQSWHGYFSDADKNGLMEFQPWGKTLPKGSWTPELNFLSWTPNGQKTVQTLPADTKFRISVQWREPHDPDYFFRADDEDYYLRPLKEMRIIILKQRDPTGKTFSQDDFYEVAHSQLVPRLTNSPNFSTYELFVEWKTPKEPGRYAFLVERVLDNYWFVQRNETTGDLEFFLTPRQTPTGIRPKDVPTLPAFEKNWEFHPRICLRAIEGEGFGKGRPQFDPFVTSLGTTALPAVGHNIFAVGAVDFEGKMQPYSSAGPPAYQALAVLPKLLSVDRLGLFPDQTGPSYGSSLATPFAAGTAATLLSKGYSKAQLRQILRCHERGIFTALPELKQQE